MTNYQEKYLNFNPMMQRWNEGDLNSFFARLDNVFPKTLNSSQTAHLHRVYNKLKTVSDMLQDLGTVELAVAGSAAYHLLTGNCEKVNDIDIVVYLPKKFQSRFEYDRKNHQEITDLVLNEIIKYDSATVYLTVNDYLHNALYGVIKVGDADLLISDCGVTDFVHSFDFGICKAFITYDSSVKCAEDLLKNLIPKVSCVRDIEEKTLTMNLKNFTVEHIEYFMNKHYLKLKQKFPDHRLNFRNANSSNITIAERYSLNIDEPEKDRKKLIKI